MTTEEFGSARRKNILLTLITIGLVIIVGTAISIAVCVP